MMYRGLSQVAINQRARAAVLTHPRQTALLFCTPVFVQDQLSVVPERLDCWAGERLGWVVSGGAAYASGSRRGAACLCASLSSAREIRPNGFVVTYESW